MFRFWFSPSRKRMNILKHDIRRRLNTEDYTCRIPRPKPRVRYKLQRVRYYPRNNSLASILGCWVYK